MKTIAILSLFFIHLFLPNVNATNVPAANAYMVSDIPEELTEDVHVVIRKKDMQIELQSVDRAVLHVHTALTIMDKQARQYSDLVIPYSVKLSKVNNIEARIYNKYGKMVKRLKKSDFNDMAYPDQVSLISGQRMVVADMEYTSYPYTIEYSYDKVISGLIRQPYWSPLFSPEVALQSAKLVIQAPSSMPFTYKQVNYDEEPIKSTKGNFSVYTWYMKNIKAIEREPNGPKFSELNPKVYLMADGVKMGKTEGKMDSWESFGKFYYKLNEGRDVLPDEMAQRVKSMIHKKQNKYEIIDTLYRYMQNNTRYVSVQLGIGGWQTFDAEYVFKNGYGDCKALSNYMKSMLKAANIPAHFVLVGAGTDKPPVNTGFVNDPFNHVILCVPLEQDTVWLECTSSLNPTGYLGDFTEDRHVLVCTPQGGKLVKTPGSTSEMNVQFRKTKVDLSVTEASKVNVKMVQTGFQQDRVRGMVAMASTQDQKKWLEKTISAPGFKLTSFSFNEDATTSVPAYHTEYEIEAQNWASATGSRIFLTPNVLERRSSVPEKVEERKYQVVINYSYLDRDTVEYNLPKGYSVESMPDMPKEIKSSFGEYRINMISDQPGKLIYVREIRINKSRLSPEMYKEYRDFYRDVVKADKVQVVLSNKS